MRRLLQDVAGADRKFLADRLDDPLDGGLRVASALLRSDGALFGSGQLGVFGGEIGMEQLDVLVGLSQSRGEFRDLGPGLPQGRLGAVGAAFDIAKLFLHRLRRVMRPGNGARRLLLALTYRGGRLRHERQYRIRRLFGAAQPARRSSRRAARFIQLNQSVHNLVQIQRGQGNPRNCKSMPNALVKRILSIWQEMRKNLNPRSRHLLALLARNTTRVIHIIALHTAVDKPAAMVGSAQIAAHLATRL